MGTEAVGAYDIASIGNQANSKTKGINFEYYKLIGKKIHGYEEKVIQQLPEGVHIGKQIRAKYLNPIKDHEHNKRNEDRLKHMKIEFSEIGPRK